MKKAGESRKPSTSVAAGTRIFTSKPPPLSAPADSTVRASGFVTAIPFWRAFVSWGNSSRVREDRSHEDGPAVIRLEVEAQGVAAGPTRRSRAQPYGLDGPGTPLNISADALRGVLASLTFSKPAAGNINRTARCPHFDYLEVDAIAVSAFGQQSDSRLQTTVLTTTMTTVEHRDTPSYTTVEPHRAWSRHPPCLRIRSQRIRTKAADRGARAPDVHCAKDIAGHRRSTMRQTTRENWISICP